MNIIVWGILAYYFDRVLPNENGYNEHPLFFLLPNSILRPASRINRVASYFNSPEQESEDVRNEREQVQHLINDKQDANDMGLLIFGLRKVYTTFWQRLFGESEVYNDPTQARRIALHELSLSVRKGELLAFLGSNGAGKTTTMKILYGSCLPTSGNALIFGNSVWTNMADIRKILGVCPQFDVIFPDLTAAEHIELFGEIKGISKSALAQVCKERLEHMRLWDVRNQQVGEFSGGMKRRLSVIIATLGDPLCLFY
jgi:ABC-type glutathione transport system ATPase component